MHVGYAGLLQNFADGLKLFRKNTFPPREADGLGFYFGPTAYMVTSLAIFGILPISSGWNSGALPLSLLLALTIFSFAPLFIFVSAWSSNNKYSLMGGVRSAAQMIAYEVPLLLAVVAVLALGLLVQSEFGWALFNPEIRVPDLHRSVILMVSAAVMTLVAGFGIERIVRSGSDWIAAGRRAGAWLAGLTLATLAAVLVQEFEHYVPDLGTPLAMPAAVVFGAALAGLVVGCLACAVTPRLDPFGLSDSGRQVYVYAAEVLILITVVHFRLTLPDLFRWHILTKYWMLMVMDAAFAGAALSELFHRRGMPVLSEPLQRTAMLLPLAPAIGFWISRLHEHSSWPLAAESPGSLVPGRGLLRVPGVLRPIDAANREFHSLELAGGQRGNRRGLAAAQPGTLLVAPADVAHSRRAVASLGGISQPQPSYGGPKRRPAVPRALGDLRPGQRGIPAGPRPLDLAAADVDPPLAGGRDGGDCVPHPLVPLPWRDLPGLRDRDHDPLRGGRPAQDLGPVYLLHRPGRRHFAVVGFYEKRRVEIHAAIKQFKQWQR